MLDVAMDSKLGPCLGGIMNSDPYRSYSTDLLLRELNNCPLSALDSKSFMNFWLFDSEIPILIFSTSSASKGNRQGYLKLSHKYFCPWKSIQKVGCNEALDPKHIPYFAVTLYDIWGHMLMPKIVYKGGDDGINTYPLDFNPLENPLFIGNFMYKKILLIQYPNPTYKAFMRWCFDNLRNESAENFPNEGVRIRPLTFFVFDMFHLALRNLISLEWLFVLSHWADIFPGWKNNFRK